MNQQTFEQEVRRLAQAVAAVKTPEEALLLLRDLCSAREIDDLAGRLHVAQLLAQGESYAEVQRVTGASSTTVSRVSKCLNGENGGYRLVLGRMGFEEKPQERMPF